MADWSQLLPSDIWCLIGLRLEVVGDRIRFRSVCKTWRSLLPFPQPPWLMLAEDECAPTTRGFFGLDGADKQVQEVYQFEFPEAHHTRCVGSTGTWLIVIEFQERIRLLNPFSRVQIDLPSQRTFEHGHVYRRDPGFELTAVEIRDSLVHKVILSSPPSSGECIAMAIHNDWFKIAFARPGDAAWTTVGIPVHLIEDIIFYRGRFHAITRQGVLMVCNLGDAQKPPRATILTDVMRDFKEWRRKDIVYLVEWTGELLMVIKFMYEDNVTYKVDRFEVYKFNFDTKWWDEVKNFGEYSLFLGFNTSVAVFASNHSGLKRNCIYFTDDYTWGYSGLKIPGGGSMGIFDMEDNSVRSHYKGMSTSLYSPPLWIVPQIHLASTG